MRQSDTYWEAYRQWKKLELADLNAADRLSREQANERG